MFVFSCGFYRRVKVKLFEEIEEVNMRGEKGEGRGVEGLCLINIL